MTCDDTAALVARARRGEAAAFELLVRHHFRAAYAVALAVLQSPAEAEDMAQEAFLVAFQRLQTCREPQRFAGWLVQIVRNRALNALASFKLRARAAEQASQGRPQSAQAPEVAGEKERLCAALGQVSPAQREVVLLHDLEGWTHPEIAAALGISEVMSRQHLFQARKALRALLAESVAKTGADGAQGGRHDDR